MRRLASLVLLFVGQAWLACARENTAREHPASSTSSTSLPVASSTASAAPDTSEASLQTKTEVVLVAGGDIDLSRVTGRRLRNAPDLDPFASIRPWLDTGDLRFANLESPLCFAGDDDNSPLRGLVFAGPSKASATLKRARWDIVSTANNHAYDFGLGCLTQTANGLQSEGIALVGTDPEGRAPGRPVVLQSKGQRIAFVAATGLFNHGTLRTHKARAYLSDLDIGEMKRAIDAIRPQADWIVASIHLGSEYSDALEEANQAVLRAVIDSGAHVVLGHHSHTAQRIDVYRGKPIFHSLGNLVFRHHSEKPWTAWSYMARIRLGVAGEIGVEVCPVYLFDGFPRPQTKVERDVFFRRIGLLSRAPRAYRMAEETADGCVRMRPP